jgi:hypothetical protein
MLIELWGGIWLHYMFMVVRRSLLNAFFRRRNKILTACFCEHALLFYCEHALLFYYEHALLFYCEHALLSYFCPVRCFCYKNLDAKSLVFLLQIPLRLNCSFTSCLCAPSKKRAKKFLKNTRKNKSSKMRFNIWSYLICCTMWACFDDACQIKPSFLDSNKLRNKSKVM